MTDEKFREMETSRLRIVRMVHDHAAAFLSYRADPEVARYQSWQASFSLDDAQSFISRQEASHPDTPGEWFQFAALSKATGELVGDCALGVDESDPRIAEIGFTMSRAVWRQGLATEAVTAVLDYAFGRRGKHRVTATVDVRNESSIALLAKLNFQREAHFRKNIWFKGAWGDEYVFAMLQNEWSRRAPDPLRIPGDGEETSTDRPKTG